MKKYFKIFFLSFQTFLEYRWELFSKYFVEMVGVFFMLFVWKAITDEYGNIGGYSFESFVVYYLLFGIFRNLKASDIWVTFDEWIRTGNLSIWLTKPMDAKMFAIFREISRVLMEMAVTLFVYVPIILLIPLFRHSIVISLETIIWVLLFSVLTFIFTSLFYLSIGLMAFWLKSTYGLGNIVQQTINILRGAWFPLDIAPLWFQNLVFALPFAYTLYTPIKIILGGGEKIDYLKGIWVLIVTSLICFVIVKLMWKTGLKQYEAVGQ